MVKYFIKRAGLLFTLIGIIFATVILSPSKPYKYIKPQLIDTIYVDYPTYIAIVYYGEKSLDKVNMKRMRDTINKRFHLKLK